MVSKISSALNWLRANTIIICSIPLFTWQLANGWFYFGTRGGFGDFLFVLERADCLPISWETLYSERTNNICTGYNYGSVLLKVLNLIGLGQSAVIPIGYTLLVIVVFIFLQATLHITSILQAVLYVSLLFSPPMILLFERANLDSLILIFVTIYATLVVHRYFSAAFFIAVLASLFKFYTVPLLLVAIFGAKKNKKLPLVIISVLIMIQVYLDIKKIPQIPWDARNMFGNAVWGEYLLYLLKGSGTHAHFFFSTILGLGILVAMWWRMSKKLNIFEYWAYSGSKDQIFFLVYFSVYLTCFFIGLSVDYRLAFLLFAFIYFEKTIRLKVSMKILTRVCILITFYFSYNLEYLQPIGDLAQMVFISFLIVLMGPFINLIAVRLVKKIRVVAYNASCQILKKKVIRRD